MGAGPVATPQRPQLTGQEQQQFPQAPLVELQDVTVILAFLLLQESPRVGCSGGGTRAGPLPTRAGSFPSCWRGAGPPDPPTHLSNGSSSHLQRDAEPRLVLGHLCKATSQRGAPQGRRGGGTLRPKDPIPGTPFPPCCWGGGSPPKDATSQERSGRVPLLQEVLAAGGDQGLQLLGAGDVLPHLPTAGG